MRTLLSQSLLLLGLLCLSNQARAQGEDAKLERFFRAYLDKSFRLQPLHATEMGDHRFDAQLEDLSPAGRARWLDLTRATLGKLPKEIDYQKLSRAAQIDF